MGEMNQVTSLGDHGTDFPQMALNCLVAYTCGKISTRLLASSWDGAWQATPDYQEQQQRCRYPSQSRCRSFHSTSSSTMSFAISPIPTSQTYVPHPNPCTVLSTQQPPGKNSSVTANTPISHKQNLFHVFP